MESVNRLTHSGGASVSYRLDRVLGFLGPAGFFFLVQVLVLGG